MDITMLEEKARTMRVWIMKSIAEARSGHPGGSLSLVEIMVWLYYVGLRVGPGDEWNDKRDRVVLTKGHGAPALYTIMAMKGFLPMEELLTLRKLGSRLQGHPDMKKLPGVEMSTGSLGHGLSVANGMALGLRLRGIDSKVVALMGDGELQEGQVWEAAMTAAHFKLNNLTAFVDYNNLQIDGRVDEIMDVAPIGAKFAAFGWEVLAIDGHSFTEIAEAFSRPRVGKPRVIVAHTVKGKGVDYMENVADWHGKAPSKEQVAAYIESMGGVGRG
ncbi:MAG TPA: transketolase [Bacillota bacterium]|nr:transketolase [Bacillota bacterium]